MNRRTFGKLVGGGAASGAVAPAAQTRPGPVRCNSPVDVGSKAQLFVDRFLIRDSRGVVYTLHPAVPHPANPLVRADQPWEGWRLELFGTVLFDQQERLFKMWYVAEPVGWFGPEPTGASGDNPTCYAVSDDGILWRKPPVGTLDSPLGRNHNVLLFATHLPSVTKDMRDPDPARRYKMICYINHPKAERGYYTMVSPDGIHWKRHGTATICRGADVINGYFDRQRGLWVAMAKIGTPMRGHNRRVFYLITSQDFEHWTDPELALYPDLEDDAGVAGRLEEVRGILDVPDDPFEMHTDFYGTGFHETESCTLAFPWVFTINNKARYGNQEGPFEIQLAVSRDLKNWQRPFRVPCLPLGVNGDWECGLQLTASQTVTVGDEVWLYYCGANYTHGTPVLYRKDSPDRKTKYTSSIGLAKWQRDRFISADGGREGGELTTVPVTFSGDRLELNARVKPGGSLRVELLDAARRPIEGLGASQSVQGDSLRHTVRWPGGRSVAAWKGKPVTLRFRLQAAELFSFAFREG
ncbi:MAG: hypothetical protein NTY38_14820 [Acidobacteria bacterium]|nr:hypothetical protein [Acidobacteriota bacterium]